MYKGISRDFNLGYVLEGYPILQQPLRIELEIDTRYGNELSLPTTRPEYVQRSAKKMWALMLYM